MARHIYVFLQNQLFACWVIFILLLLSAYIFQNLPFPKILSGALSECQTVWIQIRTNILWVLIWVRTVCKGYYQTTKVTDSKERVEKISNQNTHSNSMYSGNPKQVLLQTVKTQMKCSIMLHFIRVYTVCKGKKVLRTKEYNIFLKL